MPNAKTRRGVACCEEKKKKVVALQASSMGLMPRFLPRNPWSGITSYKVFIYVDVFLDWVMISGYLHRVEWL